MAHSHAPPDPAFVLRGHHAAVTALAFHPSGAALAAGDSDGELWLWDLAHRRPVVMAQPHSRHAGVLWTAFWGEDRILTQGRNGEVKAWGLLPSGALTDTPLWQLSSGSHNFTRLALMPSPDGSVVRGGRAGTNNANGGAGCRAV